MNHDEFVGQVQARARLGSSGAAEGAIRATLETLAERLEHGIASHVAAQLPPEIGRHLRTDAPFERLTVDQFFDRICRREGTAVDPPEAVYHARVVLEVLGEAVSAGTIEKVKSTLPEDFRAVFDAGSQGRMRLGDEGSRQTQRPQ